MKYGDKVKIISGSEFYLGLEGTLTRFDYTGGYMVKFGISKSPFDEIFFQANQLELINES